MTMENAPTTVGTCACEYCFFPTCIQKAVPFICGKFIITIFLENVGVFSFSLLKISATLFSLAVTGIYICSWYFLISELIFFYRGNFSSYHDLNLCEETGLE